MFFKKNKAIGLDISKDSVKISCVRREDSAFTIVALAMAKLASEPIEEEASSLYIELASNAIKKILKDTKLSPKYVNTGVSGNGVIVRYLKLPKMSESELRDVVKFELEDHLPFDVERTIIDFQILRHIREKDEDMMEIVVAAAKEELIYEHLEILQRVNLQTNMIDVNTFAIENLWDIEATEEEKKMQVALVDIGARLTNVNILEENKSTFNRDIMIGGNDFTDAIAKELKIDFRKAEEFKQTYGMIITEKEEFPTEEKVAKASYALEGAAARLVGELDRSFAYYYTQYPVYRKGIDLIVLGGGGIKLKGLVQYIEKSLGIKTKLFIPQRKIRIGGRLDEITLRKDLPHFITSIGLAIKSLVW